MMLHWADKLDILRDGAEVVPLRRTALGGDTMKECTRRGRYCTNPSFMGTLSATPEDVERWNNEHRWDILRYASVFPDGDADLWIDRLWAANSNRGSVSDPPL